jgi:lycopene beta-cyclase
MSKTHFDYIIAGGGLSGLSLLYYISKEPALKNKSILVIDAVEKNQNDRTWCFWEKDQDFYEPLVYARWNRLKFESPTLNRTFALRDYAYKLIRSVDYYRFVKEAVSKVDVQYVTETIQSIVDSPQGASVKTNVSEYSSTLVFNSTGLFNPTLDPSNTLLQHFEGWFIRTNHAAFDSSVGTLMDFTLSQAKGITFMYILPTSAHEALVEYTLFSEALLEKEEYKKALSHYIEHNLKLNNYEITHTEFGVIPMSTAKFKPVAGKYSNIINIGTAGGYTKASTGYTFKFVHKKLKKIVSLLASGKKPDSTPSLREKMFHWYDMTLLDVLLSKKVGGEHIFTNLFKKNDPERVLAFLADESTHLDEFKIRNSVPLAPFAQSGIKQLFS